MESLGLSDVRKSELTAFVRKLRKSDLVSELSRVNLVTEGTRDELRSRLLSHCRQNPEEYQKIAWVYQLGEDSLKEELKELELSVEGSAGDLYYRLVEYVRENVSRFAQVSAESISGETVTTEKSQIMKVEFPRKPVIETIRKWNVRFQPGDSVFTFLERIAECRGASDISDEEMLTALPEILKGTALLWFRNNKYRWRNWDMFLENFKLNYLPADVEDVLMDEIRLRTQGDKETMSDYVTALCTLMRRLPIRLTSEQEFRWLKKNLRPEYKLFLGTTDIPDVTTLLEKGRQYEKIVLESERYRPPPPVSKSVDKDTAYDSRKSKTLPQLQMVSASNTMRMTKNDIAKDSNTVSQNKKKEATVEIRGNLKSKSSCWNCGQGNHTHRMCKAPRKQFCYRCGKPNVIAPNCTCKHKINS